LKYGLATKYAITSGNINITCNDKLSNFTAGNSGTYQKTGEWYSFIFNPQSKGYSSAFYFKVIAKGERGSETPSNSDTGTLISYPYYPQGFSFVLKASRQQLESAFSIWK
jgi:hypothetical protein